MRGRIREAYKSEMFLMTWYTKERRNAKIKQRHRLCIGSAGEYEIIYVCKKDKVKLLGDSGTAIILDLKSVLEVFGQEEIKTYLENTLLNPGGIRLDSYLHDISVSWIFRFDSIKVSRKLSELCNGGWNTKEKVFAAYDCSKDKLCMRDIEGEELRKYIAADHMMVLAIQGIKEEERASFAAWKQWDTRIDFPPLSILKAIYFPVGYDESLLRYCEEGGHSDNFSGAVWHGLKKRALTAVLRDINIKNILRQCGLLTEWFRIELGIFPVISVESDRYIEYVENWWGSANEKVNEHPYYLMDSVYSESVSEEHCK